MITIAVGKIGDFTEHQFSGIYSYHENLASPRKKERGDEADGTWGGNQHTAVLRGFIQKERKKK